VEAGEEDRMNLSGTRPSLAATLRAAAVVVVSAWIFAACGESKEEEPMPVEESVFGDQVEAIDKVEDQVGEMEARKQDLDAQLEEAEGESRNDRAD
jgi:hypothetical protein